jgi:hypothetical protein
MAERSSAESIRRTAPDRREIAVDATDAALQDAVCRNTKIGSFSEHRSTRADDEIDALQERGEGDGPFEHNRLVPPREVLEIGPLPSVAWREDHDSLRHCRQVLECAKCETSRFWVVVVALLGRWPKQNAHQCVIDDLRER